MKEELFIQRIMVSVAQIILVPLCFLGVWGRLTPDGIAVKDSWQKLTFAEASQRLTGNKAFVYVVVVCAVLVIAVVWTKFYYYAFVPAGVQFLLWLVLYVYFSILRRSDIAFADIISIFQLAAILVGFMLSLLMLKGHLKTKKKSAGKPTPPAA